MQASKAAKCIIDCGTSDEADSVHAAKGNDNNACRSKVTCKIPDEYRTPSPTFLLALGLENTRDTTVSETRGSGSYDDAGDVDVSSKAKLTLPPKKRPYFRSVPTSKPSKTASTLKEKGVSKPKDRVKKNIHETASSEALKKVPEVSAKKSHKPVAPTAAKGVSKREQQTKKKQQKKSTSSKASDVSSAECKPASSTSETHLDSESKVIRSFWNEALVTEFKSSKFSKLLENCEFSETQKTVIQETLNHLCRQFYDFSLESVAEERSMKTHKCVVCDFSISHECISENPTPYWLIGNDDNPPIYITPESTTMCKCNFAIYHSHTSKSRTKHQDHQPIDNALSMLEHSRTVTLCCPRCNMNILIRNRKKDVCGQIMNWAGIDGPRRRKFYDYVREHVISGRKKIVVTKEFFSCENNCCSLFHRCSDEIIPDTLPIQVNPSSAGCIEGALT